MNHNLETVPRLYKQARPGSDYAHSLRLLREFKARVPGVPTKSGLMVGLGETDDEILAVMRDMRAHDIDMLTHRPVPAADAADHLPVLRYVHPDTFAMFEREAYAMGFRHAAVGALVRSSYHADQQAEEVLDERARARFSRRDAAIWLDGAYATSPERVSHSCRSSFMQALAPRHVAKRGRRRARVLT